MKLTKTRLNQIIKEELSNILEEGLYEDKYAKSLAKSDPKEQWVDFKSSLAWTESLIQGQGNEPSAERNELEAERQWLQNKLLELSSAHGWKL